MVVEVDRPEVGEEVTPVAGVPVVTPVVGLVGLVGPVVPRFEGTVEFPGAVVPVGPVVGAVVLGTVLEEPVVELTGWL